MNGVLIPGGRFVEKDHHYFDMEGRRVLSVTQVFAMLKMVDYSHIEEEVLERKSQIGVATHRALEFLCEGTLDWDTVDPVAMPYVVGGEGWMSDMNFVSLAREQQGIHTEMGMKFGFQYDSIGQMLFRGRMRHALVDYKTCVDASPTWELQTAAYEIAAPPLPNGERYVRVVLQLMKDGRCKPHYFDSAKDRNTFLYALHTAIWKQNKGYAIDEKKAA